MNKKVDNIIIGFGKAGKILANYLGDKGEKTILVEKSHEMCGGGFEPPKQFAADLQSVPFGHSGIHPYSFYLMGPIGLEPMTLCL